MKGLIVDEPWISSILSGEKTWEMRKTANHDRGLVALIRKGSGSVVGVAQLVDCKAPIRPEEYAATERFHGIRGDAQRWAIESGYLVPWVLEAARSLPKPVAYRHKPGSQSRIILDDDVAREVRRQIENSHVVADAAGSPQPSRASRAMPTPAREGGSRTRIVGRIDGDTAYVPLSDGNIRHGHFYLRSVLGFFPETAIGGSDASQQARFLLTVRYEPGATVRTDIAGPNRISLEKRSVHFFFRERGPIRDFFARSGAQGGDTVVIRRDAPGSYTVTLQKTSRT
ncbi:ASCH domain-containing protein [Hansschlegelia beijingensis]